MAARELKRKEWRFHKKFSVWFRRHTDPVIVNEQFEKGDVLIFDFEDSWKVKKRSNFQFDYKHLEDELQV